MNELQKGLTEHQAGNLDRAQRHYVAHLRLNPNDYYALQLMGIALASLGNFEAAIEKLKESLRLYPAQAEVLNNLGLCLQNTGCYDEAIDCFDKAINLKSDYIDAYKNLVGVLQALSRHEFVAQVLKRADSRLGNNLQIKKLWANHYHFVEKFDRAIEIYTELLDQDSGSASLKLSLAINLRLSGRPKDALVLYQELEQAGLSKYQLFHNMANALSDLGQSDKAIDYYRRAISKNPLYVESHVNLNALLWESGTRDQFLRSYELAIEQHAKQTELLSAYVATLLRVGEPRKALKFLESSELAKSDDVRFFDLLGRAYRDLGHGVRAVEVHRKVLAVEGGSVDILNSVVESMLEQSLWDEAENVIERILLQDPNNKHAWALRGIVWQALNDERADKLNNYQDLVKEYVIQPPSEFNSMEEFCSELNHYLSTLHTANQQPLEQTLNGGTQTRGHLFQDPHPLVQHIVSQFRLCVLDYIKQTSPLLAAVPAMQKVESFRFPGSWSVRLADGGHHSSHIHPMGWLSSAFYVNLPTSTADDDDKHGWFKLGEPNLKLSGVNLRTKFIKPEIGKLVLFQSYMWHRTTPFTTKHADETRTTIAFDVASNDV
ncbi:MAG: tetratricopeptide repeat protein [Acidiferrobacterales bacterium]|nr:tetratricopeptide repeat protein [Acidiferrobacterales bacterium]